MENQEEIHDILTHFEKKPSQDIPSVLEEYLRNVAKTGKILFPWSRVKPLFLCKLEQVMEQFHKDVPFDHLSPFPNVENIKYTEMKSRIVDSLQKFNGAPFTVQRICELVTQPRKHYTRCDKFLRGIEKNVQVVSSVDTQGTKIVSESSHGLMNGLDVNGFSQQKDDITDGQPFVPLRQTDWSSRNTVSIWPGLQSPVDSLDAVIKSNSSDTDGNQHLLDEASDVDQPVFEEASPADQHLSEGTSDVIQHIPEGALESDQHVSEDAPGVNQHLSEDVSNAIQQVPEDAPDADQHVSEDDEKLADIATDSPEKLADIATDSPEKLADIATDSPEKLADTVTDSPAADSSPLLVSPSSSTSASSSETTVTSSSETTVTDSVSSASSSTALASGDSVPDDLASGERVPDEAEAKKTVTFDFQTLAENGQSEQVETASSDDKTYVPSADSLSSDDSKPGGEEPSQSESCEADVKLTETATNKRVESVPDEVDSKTDDSEENGPPEKKRRISEPEDDTVTMSDDSSVTVSETAAAETTEEPSEKETEEASSTACTDGEIQHEEESKECEQTAESKECEQKAEDVQEQEETVSGSSAEESKDSVDQSVISSTDDVDQSNDNDSQCAEPHSAQPDQSEAESVNLVSQSEVSTEETGFTVSDAGFVEALPDEVSDSGGCGEKCEGSKTVEETKINNECNSTTEMMETDGADNRTEEITSEAKTSVGDGQEPMEQE